MNTIEKIENKNISKSLKCSQNQLKIKVSDESLNECSKEVYIFINL